MAWLQNVTAVQEDLKTRNPLDKVVLGKEFNLNVVIYISRISS